MYKGKQITDGEDRTEAYRDWRHTFGNSLYVLDVDQVEYKFENDDPVPVAVIELTRADGPVYKPEKLQAAVLHRITEKGPQGKTLLVVADAIGVEAYIVLFLSDLSEFHLYNLTNPTDWKIYNQDRYKKWIKWLHR